MPNQLSSRLQAIKNMISGDYDHIWDTCCDHGQLGMALLQQHHSSKIHFVDQVRQITEALKKNLPQEPHGNWKVYTLDCAQIQLLPHDKKHLVVIAGVGGELARDLVTTIAHNHPSQIIEFIINPVHHTYTLREALIQLKFGLVNEEIIEDNNRFYEVIHISTSQKGLNKITATGKKMWDFNNPIHNTYINKLISHYSNKAKGGDKIFQRIAQEYQLLIRL